MWRSLLLNANATDHIDTILEYVTLPNFFYDLSILRETLSKASNRPVYLSSILTFSSRLLQINYIYSWTISSQEVARSFNSLQIYGGLDNEKRLYKWKL